MKIIDTFLFYNEEKLLDFRLNYYKNTVDYFIIVESTKTFSGMDKLLYFNNIKYKYSHFNNIIHIIIENIPLDKSLNSSSINWHREFYQRNYIKNALKDIPNISDEDWIMINDVDEFPNRDKLLTVKNSSYYSSSDKIGYTLEFDMYYYNLTSKLNHKWYKVKLLRYHVVKNIDLNIARDSLVYPKLIEFGWHFSYFFSYEMIKNKIQAFSHQEFNYDKYTNKEHIEDCIKNGKSIFYLDKERNEKIIYTPIHSNPNLPEGYEVLNENNTQENTITVITAFYDIGRGDWKKYNRNVDLYFNSFKKYLLLPYNIVAFIDDRYLDKIPIQIKNCKVIPINYEWLISNLESWKKLEIAKEIMNLDSYRHLVKHRIECNYPENISAEYNTINHSKIDFIYYCIVNNIVTSELVCWSDFGYHNSILKNNIYPYSTIDINKLNQNKLNFWLRNNIEENDFDIINTLVNAREVFTGSFFAGPLYLMLKLYCIYHINLNDMYSRNISDDDQHIYLRCYFSNPDIFELYISNNEWPRALVNIQTTFINKLDLIKYHIQYKKNIIEIGSGCGELSKFILSNNNLYYIDTNDQDSYNKIKYGHSMILNFLNDINEQIDFIYYKYILDDIPLWYEKLSYGGIIILDCYVDYKRDIEWFINYATINNLIYCHAFNQIVLFKPLI